MNELTLSLLLPLGRTTLLLGAAAAAVWLLLRMARPSSPAIHRAAWFLVLTQGWLWLRLPVAIPYYEAAAHPAVTPDQRFLVATADHTPLKTQAARLAAVSLKQPTNLAGPMVPTPLAPKQAAEQQRLAFSASWLPLVAGIWLTGIVGLAGAVLVSYMRFLFCLRVTGPVEDNWAREWADLLVQHHIRKSIPLHVTSSVGPLLCWAPRGHLLIVPEPLWQRLTPAGRLSILRHELAHFERGDLWKSMIVRLLALPHWFNPLAWLVVRRFDEAAEWACDQVAKGADLNGCRAYAKALLQLDAACGPRPSYHAAASSRGLSARVQRLLSPQVKEDSIMKKITILGIALGLALLCLVRLDLVAKEVAEKDRATVPPRTQPTNCQLGAAVGAAIGAAMGSAVGSREFAAGEPLGSQPQEPKTTPAAVDVLRYMPNGCQTMGWWAGAALRFDSYPTEWSEGFASCLGLHSTDFMTRVTVGSMGGFGLPPSVAVATLARPVTVSELKANIEKERGTHPWREETVGGVTLHVHESDKPLAFFLPAERTLVLGSAELVREALARGTPVQLPDKLAAAWARLDQSREIGLMMLPPTAGDSTWAFLPADVREGIEATLVNADLAAGKTIRFRLSIPCVDAGIAYQVRGACATYCTVMSAQAVQNPSLAEVLKSLRFAVKDRCFTAEGTGPLSLFQGNSGASSTSQVPLSPQQQVLCNMSEVYLKGFQYGLMDPRNKEEAGRQFLARATKRSGEFQRDAKLNDAQRMFRDLSEVADQGFLQAAGWQDLDPKEKNDEQRWLKQLSSDNESGRMLAIYALTAMKSKKAVPGILHIAAERTEKDNADREEACRALGIIGELSVVPDLVQLTYHYNRDTRFWAQISLVRLTGENFGRDVAAWRKWWAKQGGKPPISEENVAWATSPQMLPYADEKSMEAADRGILEMAQKLSKGRSVGTTSSAAPTAR
jgi:beta-lactamase regulating signal transducer with metallopeptidase domain